MRKNQVPIPLHVANTVHQLAVSKGGIRPGTGSTIGMSRTNEATVIEADAGLAAAARAIAADTGAVGAFLDTHFGKTPFDRLIGANHVLESLGYSE